SAVGRSLLGITTWLHFMGARVRHVILPEGEDGAKTGLDDYLAAGHSAEEITALARAPAPGRPARPEDSASTPPAASAHLHPPPALASDQDILGRLVHDLRVCIGLVGEDRNAKLTYLAVVSRLLEDPVSLAMKGLSSSGKSFTVDTVLRFFPERA